MRRERVPFAMAGSGSACRQDQWAEPLWGWECSIPPRVRIVTVPCGDADMVR